MRAKTKSIVFALFSGALTFAGTLPGHAQQIVSVQNLVYGTDKDQIRIPRIDFDGPTLSQAELAAIFSPGQVGQLADRLRRLSARSMTIPEIVFSLSSGPQPQEFRSGQVAFIDISGGKAKAMRIGATNITVNDPSAGPIAVQIGAIGADNVDVAFMASIFTEAQTPGPKRVIYDNFVMDGMSMNFGNKSTLRFGRMVAGEVKMRPLKHPFATFLSIITDSSGPPSGEKLKTFLEVYADYFESYDSAAAELAGAEFVTTDAKTGKPIRVTLSRIVSAPFIGGVLQGFSFEGLKAVLPDGSFNVGSFGVKAIDFRPFITAIGKMGSTPPETFLAANWRDIIPNFFGLYLTGFEIDVPHEKKAGQRVNFGIGQFDLNLGNHILGIPTDIGIAWRNVVADLAKFNDPDIQVVLAMGYNEIKAHQDMRLIWDEATKSIRYTDRVIVEQALDLSAEGTIINVPAELFGKDLSLMQNAALGMTVRDLKLALANLGLYEKILAMAAQQAGGNADALKGQIAGMASAMIPGFLGNSPGAQSLTKAVTSFIQSGKTLTISARAKAPGGIGLADAMMISSPEELLDKVELQASAN